MHLHTYSMSALLTRRWINNMSWWPYWTSDVNNVISWKYDRHFIKVRALLKCKTVRVLKHMIVIYMIWQKCSAEKSNCYTQFDHSAYSWWIWWSDRFVSGTNVQSEPTVLPQPCHSTATAMPQYCARKLDVTDPEISYTYVCIEFRLGHKVASDGTVLPTYFTQESTYNLSCVSWYAMLVSQDDQIF